MNNTRCQSIFCATTACIAVLLCTAPVRAQQGEQPSVSEQKSGEIGEIMVTARKREESILNVPVVETAIPQVQIERIQTVEMTDLPNLVPGLLLGHNVLAEGTALSIRGIGTTSQDPGVDQSVTLNIDGLSLSNGLAAQSGLFDLQQIEVLKGPQSLFYGKSSTGGVISLRTADPTNELELQARTSYEFEAKTPREEAIISGPVTDTLKLRLATMYSTTQGYFYNVAVPVLNTGALPPDPRAPGGRDYVVRGTALWEPSSQFSARLKVTLADDRANVGEEPEFTDCPEGPNFEPFGIPFIGGTNCKIGREIRNVYLNPADFIGVANNGVPYIDNNQKFGTLELNYLPRQDLTLTSVTGYYLLQSNSLTNATETTAAAPAVAAQTYYRDRNWSEEVRLNSEFAFPVNFTVGGLYLDRAVGDHTAVPANIAYGLPPSFGDSQINLPIKAYSFFGQLRYQIIPRLELSAGARWTDEKKSERAFNLISGTPVLIPVTVPTIRFDNWSPEFTLTYRPTDDITMFASYKKAYKSGSYVLAGEPTPGSDNSFRDEEARGGEIGLKTRLLDRTLGVNLAAYYYDYSGLQVGAVEPSNGGQFLTTTVNAGSARSYGLDLDVNYHPPLVEALTLHAAANYDIARYLVLDNVPCWGGQTIANGCNQFLNTVTGLYTAQNLAGTPMVRAPDVQMNFGFNYEFPVRNNYTMNFSSSNAFSSKFVNDLAINRPNNDNYQGAYFKADLSLALRAPNNHWEIALIAKNVGDKIVAGNCSSANFGGGAVFGGQITGGTGVGPAGVDQMECNVDPGREVWVRLTVRP